MVPMYNVKILRLGFRIVSLAFSSEKEILGIQSIFRNSKLSLCCLQNLLFQRLVSSKISANEDDFAVSYLTNICGLSSEAALLASKKVLLKSPEKPDSVLSILRNHGFSQTQISNVVRKMPWVLLMNTQKTLLPKLEFFYSVGVPRKEVTTILSVNPWCLHRSLKQRIIPDYDFLKNLLHKNDKVLAILKFSPRILKGNISRALMPNIKALREDLGMPESHVALMLTHFHRPLTKRPQQFVELVKKVKEMGFDPNKAAFVLAMYALCIGSNESRWYKCHEVYKRLGWSEDDILSAFKRQPLCMVLPESKIMSNVDLMTKMGWSSSMIVKYPGVLIYSLKKRLIPRCSVIKVLILKGLTTRTYTMSSIFSQTEKKFLKRFVYKYPNELPQLLSVYEGKVKIQIA